MKSTNLNKVTSESQYSYNTCELSEHDDIYEYKIIGESVIFKEDDRKERPIIII